MEPDTTSSPAAWTSPPAAAVLEHGEPSVRDTSLLSPAFSPALSPGLVAASRSGSESSSWYHQQIPPSPAAAAGNGSRSDVQEHAMSSSSSQSVPSSCFPAAGTLPSVGYDLFGNPEATAAVTPLPSLLGGQWEQGESSSSRAAAPVLPECPSPGMFGFAAEYSAAWPSAEMPSSPLFSPSSSFAGGLAPQSSDNLVGFAQPSSDSEMEEPMPQRLRIASPAVDESPVVDAPMPPIEDEEEEEEEIDVSSFLVSDPEDQLPNVSWTASLQMAGSGGGASSTSSMAPGSTGNNWPPMLAAVAASMCYMASSSSGSMACHSGGTGTSKGVAGAIANMMMPSSPVLPLAPQSSQVAGASSSNFNGFVQPPSSSVLAPHAPNLQGPLLPVKQENMEYVDVTERRHPDFISLVDDDDEDGLYQDATFGSWGSNSCSPASFAPGNWPGSSTGNPSFGHGSWGGGSSSPSIAPGYWGNSTGWPSFAPSSWGGVGSSSRLSFAPDSLGGSSSRPSFHGTVPCFDQSTYIDNCGSSSMQKLTIRGKMASIPGLPPLPRAGVSTRNGTRIVFTDSDKAIIAKDKKLQELLRTDPKKVKRMLYNRAYSAAANVRRAMHTKNLEHMIVTLEERRKSLREELQSLEEGSAALVAQKTEMQMLIGELEQQTMLKDVLREGLRAEIQNLKHMKLN